MDGSVPMAIASFEGVTYRWSEQAQPRNRSDPCGRNFGCVCCQPCLRLVEHACLCFRRTAVARPFVKPTFVSVCALILFATPFVMIGLAFAKFVEGMDLPSWKSQQRLRRPATGACARPATGGARLQHIGFTNEM